MIKKSKLILLLGALTLLTSCGPSSKSKTNLKLGEITPVAFTEVHFTDNFWLPRMEINRTVSIPSAFYQCEINGRFDNFAIAGGLKKGEHRGDFSFDDTDPYKIIEGASYSLAVKYDPQLDAYLDSVITLIAAAQEPDGYLTTCVTNNCTRLSGWWGTKRWEKINSHELYNCGHLYEAAVAHYQATKKRTLLDVAIKNADLICETFGLGEGQIKYPSGHPIIEMALVKLHNVTGNKKYLDQARYFVDEAGRLSNGRQPGIYSQDHKPVLEQDEIVGHAVRAGYFYSGVADVASLQHDEELFNAVNRVWENMAGRKLYINGGVGSRAQGEGFGPDYELNNFNNYCETCASIANVYWNHRMFLATGDAKYVDVLERALYNGVISGVSLSGDKFFYDNPLASQGVHHRAEWFGCACCPGNVTRFMASVPAYAYATHKDDIYTNLYVEGNAIIKTASNSVEVIQKTDYPWEGIVEIEVSPNHNQQFQMLLRIPGWAKDRPVPTDLYHYVDDKTSRVTVAVNGKNIKLKTRDGYAVIDRKWKTGDKITLTMNMPVRRVQAHPKVEYNKGLLSMERGPILYTLEAIDQHTDYVFDIVIPRQANINAYFDEKLLGGAMVLEGEGYTVTKDSTDKLKETPITFKAIPYSMWNNRGYGQMVTWTPETAAHAIPKPAPTLASQAEQVGGWGINDQFEPTSSADINTPYHYWWLKAGTEESIGYRFKKPTTVSGVEVYWLAFEHYDVIYKAPESWKLLYKDGSAWKEVKNPSGYGTALDQYNVTTFDPVTTTELKIVVQLQRPPAEGSVELNGPQVVDVDRRGYSGGIIEWRVNTKVQAEPTAVPASLGIHAFYKKYIDADGIPIVSSANVRNEALTRASRVIKQILSKRPDIKNQMVKKGCKVMIIGAKEEVCDLPEYAHICDTPENIAYWNKRARGFGGAPEHDFSASCGEENVLGFTTDKYYTESILVHEFAHILHMVGIVGVEPGFNDELEALRQNAIAKGLWKNTYCISNKEEYFAETLQSFFNCNKYSETPNGVHNAIDTREKLKKYDPDMYRLLLRYLPEIDLDLVDNQKH